MITIDKEFGTSSCRGMLIDVIIQNYIKDFLFESEPKCNEVQSLIQKKLDSHLKFETETNVVEGEKDILMSGKVKFLNEDDTKSIVDFVILKTMKVLPS